MPGPMPGHVRPITMERIVALEAGVCLPALWGAGPQSGATNPISLSKGVKTAPDFLLPVEREAHPVGNDPVPSLKPSQKKCLCSEGL